MRYLQEFIDNPSWPAFLSKELESLKPPFSTR